MIIVSETDWSSGQQRAATLGDLLADFAERPGTEDILFETPTVAQSRVLGSDFDGA